MRKCIFSPKPKLFTLVGSTPEERARISMIEGAAMDLRIGFGLTCYNPKFEELKGDYLKGLPTTLKMWSDFLGDRQYLTGSSVSFNFSFGITHGCTERQRIPDCPVCRVTRFQVSHVDFMVYEALDCIRYLAPQCLDDFPKLKEFKNRIEDLPKIKEYMKSERFIKWPLHSWTSPFGGGDAPPA
ncbi:Glutathione S-transferase [Fasciola hepatica]|uniref:glutathione transferase n=1 Tax=Fasciola hepatica TaxID=6192 RepID=A0A4E0RXK6_FASHE|nr:Glutathione S-transferase [Fasciola hepatica]